VDPASIHNWETNISKRSLQYIPAIVSLLSYNPAPSPKGWADRLVQGRKSIGVTQREAAKRIGVDMSTLARWERAEREPAGQFAVRVRHFLAFVESVSVTAVRTAS
jgi:DNA-binding XRE family transcriptional regulator